MGRRLRMAGFILDWSRVGVAPGSNFAHRGKQRSSGSAWRSASAGGHRGDACQLRPVEDRVQDLGQVGV